MLAGLERGRLRAIAQAKAAAAPRERAVRAALDVDALAGHAERGRAVRIARRLRLNPRTVRKILHQLYSGSDSLGSTHDNTVAE